MLLGKELDGGKELKELGKNRSVSVLVDVHIKSAI